MKKPKLLNIEFKMFHKHVYLADLKTPCQNMRDLSEMISVATTNCGKNKFKTQIEDISNFNFKLKFKSNVQIHISISSFRSQVQI